MKKIILFNLIFIFWVIINVLVLTYLEDIFLIMVIISFNTAFIILVIVKVAYDFKNKQISLLEDRLKDQNAISFRVKQSGNEVFNNLPVGILLFDDKYNIIWMNNFSKMIFRGKTDNILISDLIGNKENLMEINDNHYSIVYSEKSSAIYLFEANEVYDLQNKYNNSQIIFGEMILDNFDETLSPLDVQEKSEVMSIYIGAIADWTNKYDMYLKPLSDERFIFICRKEMLESIIEDEFSILNSIRDLSNNNKHKITVSIGVSSGEESIVDLSEKANDMLEMALDRGGDQAVLDYNGEISYFGAKTQSHGKKSRVKARTFAQTLRRLMEKADNIVIAPHKFPDADAFGAAVALYKMSVFLKKRVNIITDLKEPNHTLNKIIENILEDDSDIIKNIINPKEAVNYVDENTLLIIVDCQLENLVINEEILNYTENIVIIDHHRRSNKSIDRAIEQFIEPYASSSVELLTEIISFFDTELNIQASEATLMLSGIIVDTNNFTYRTGARTFHAASYLIQAGADSEKVQSLLREDLNELMFNNRFLSQAKLINNKYMVAKSPDPNLIVSRETLAKASNRLLTVDNVDAAFSLGLIDSNTVGISARSFGSVNVQLIMEAMGGGGHLNNAATQVKGKTLEEVFNDLLEQLKNLD